MKLYPIIFAAIAAACLGASLPAGAAMTAADTPPATITVTGQGYISRPPDVANVDLAIVTHNDNAAQALSENNARFAALSTKLGALGIGGTDIRSTSVQSYFNARPTGTNGAPGPFGFVVTRSAQINVANLGQTGAVIDAATAAGVAQVNGVSYGFRDRRAVERAALAAAVADAFAQAEAIAAAAHVQIVRIQHITNEAGPGRMPGPLPMAAARTNEAVEPTTITPSDLDVTSSVSITYTIR
jgi:uncharacterized protein YggE